ncbi:MAG TPA: HAD-IG family 5'-nucleotidase [Gemmatimonadales bacterium]|jgi:HAD superfamily 5'-nucleotidase-like hydrolase
MTQVLDPFVPPGRGLYCNRTLNLRSIRAIGYDMDYTLVHYRIDEWEQRAYSHVKQKLLASGWPIEDLRFDPSLMVRGLILDLEHGDVLKANRFGYVKRAFHATTPLSFDEQRRRYARTLVDLNDDRWVFLNTLFSLSEACLYAQLVALMDDGALAGMRSYRDLYRTVRTSIDDAHMEGELKAEIIADPDRFVELDPDTPAALLDQKQAGKRLMVITNSDWLYTRHMMAYAFDRFLPGAMTWRDLFDLVIVSARKPAFFRERAPVFEVVNDAGQLQPVPRSIARNGVYVGGHARIVEEFLEVSGDQILYVGDHMYTDVSVSKNMLRWRTALILRELEQDVAAVVGFVGSQQRLTELMRRKERVEFEVSHLRLALQRIKARLPGAPKQSVAAIEANLTEHRATLAELDVEIAPLATAAGRLGNARWGLLLRAGNDKSHLARQVERYADVYTSRVSNFLFETPFVYLRAPRGTLPHDVEGSIAFPQEESE